MILNLRASTFHKEVFDLCNPLKSIKKVFKKAVHVVKKVAPLILVAAAIYFTAGAAMGVAGTAGGWGGAVSGLVGNLGLSSTLGGVVTGAVTQAGYGAIIGGGIAAVTGGDVNKGMLTGAGYGAVSGGVLGGMGVGTDPLAGIGETGTAAPGTAPVAGTTFNSGLEGAPMPTAGAAPVAAAPASGGLLSRAGSFIENNPTTAGLAIQGLGTGISSYASASAAAEAQRYAAQQKDREAQRIADNYAVGGGMLTGTTLDQTMRPTPTQQFNPETAIAKTKGKMWRYNPESGQIELS